MGSRSMFACGVRVDSVDVLPSLGRMLPDAPAWLVAAILAVLTWLVMSAYLAMRRRRRLPHPNLGQVVFQEMFASARCRSGSFLAQRGGARNCLSIVVTASTLHTRLLFPFYLLAAKDVFRMENSIDFTRILACQTRRKWGRHAVLIRYLDAAACEHVIEIWSRRSQDLLAVLPKR